MFCRRLMSSSPLSSEFIPAAAAGKYPKAWVAGAVATGVKKTSLDLTLVRSLVPVKAVSGVFTLNSFAAAPVQVCKSLLLQARGQDQEQLKLPQGVVVNSGCANACTGQAGLRDALEMSRLGPGGNSLVMSTGVIGQALQMDKITKGIKDLSSAPPSSTSNNHGSFLSDSHDSWLAAARGIMTTDTFPKLASREIQCGNNVSLSDQSPQCNHVYRMAGFSKGAGMIHPNMATMLSSIFTDVDISQPALDSIVKYAADRSFNAISVDGDTSTNDTFIVMANGASRVKISSDIHSPSYIAFRDELTDFAAHLAKLIVRDGEGATKFIEIRVEGAKTFNDAKQVASTIATSPLVKTAIYGRDANWGRIVCAVGYSGVEVDPQRVNLYFGTPNLPTSSETDDHHTLHLFKDGAPFDVDETKAAKILECRDISIKVNLGSGGHESATVYTCDFSTEYININADYRS